MNSNKIVTITGPRRSGKTYYMYQIIDKLLSAKVEKKSIIYINFEDERLINIEPDQIFSAYSMLYPKEALNNKYLFFDEIQVVKNWQKFVRRVYDGVTKNIFLTGSNSEIYRDKVSSSLRGRSINYHLSTLSFKEYLLFNNINPNLKTSANRKRINAYLENYIRWGGFPELVNADDGVKIKILQEYFNVMILRDIIENYEISNSVIVKNFLRKIIRSFGKEFSINKIYNELKSANIKTSKSTLYKLFDIAESVYFCEKLKQWKKGKETINELKKVYLSDIGYAKAVIIEYSEMQGRIIENIVYNHLKKENLYYMRNGYEIDFICEHSKGIDGIQVTKALSSDNYNREIEPLKNLI
ncbi:ATP-binding protein, partial [candidate division WOR-3 bacterium]|nr:ATP-binding protein [candidate division WOR-3 bacterium]